jgi:transcriptional regulator with XRE-family HTH domain
VETTPLPTLVRSFLKRTRMSQEDLARKAGVSLATINKVKRASDDQRFASEHAIRAAITQLIDQEQVGGWETVVEVQQLREDVDQLTEQLQTLIAEFRSRQS